MDFHMKKSRVIQVQGGSLSEAVDLLRDYKVDKQNSPIPIVVVPSESCNANCLFTVPDGCFWVLYQRWYKDQGPMKPGFRYFLPLWYRISHVVTKKVVCYNHPVFNCITSDNVNVEVDVSTNFQIGPTIDDVQRFVYELGAERFNDLLSDETEEAIRALVNDVPVTKMYDLREEFALDMIDNLNAAFKRLGVRIISIKVCDVKLPTHLEQTLQRRTSYQTQIEQEERIHTHAVRKLVDYSQLVLEEIKKTNKRKVQELNANVDQALISRKESTTNVKTAKAVAMVAAEATARVRVVKAEADREVSDLRGKTNHVGVVVGAQAQNDKRRVLANQDYLSRMTRAVAKYEVAKIDAKCVLAEAEAEKQAGPELLDVRNFEVAKLRMDVLTGVALKTDMVFCGETGERLLQQFTPGTGLDLSENTTQTIVR